MRCLIVDDSKAMRAFISSIVAKLGYETCEAGNGKEALERLQSTSGVSFALVDWNMPIMNGYEFVKAVRKMPEFDEVKLMMVTTETEIAQVEKALRAGANEYMMKPFSQDVLQEKLLMLGFDDSQ
jgi:two-component system, chemotaxis family, chemotaxis protein CheY